MLEVEGQEVGSGQWSASVAVGQDGTPRAAVSIDAPKIKPGRSYLLSSKM